MRGNLCLEEFHFCDREKSPEFSAAETQGFAPYESLITPPPSARRSLRIAPQGGARAFHGGLCRNSEEFRKNHFVEQARILPGNSKEKRKGFRFSPNKTNFSDPTKVRIF
ncbi:hypothetical protein CH380_07620 [Leptospira adleri]|uniref:Uncharacterized protein n=1 Tax=Leptospira adleri TaxID=2023186 RepID=A0A2M9YQR1_9LEPT|nr:hypothetical protein CH380_07620 [Leptospira adleri]PJZ63115.1 hypothetical protein CH376_04505 [Leptospira adleri]